MKTTLLLFTTMHIFHLNYCASSSHSKLDSKNKEKLQQALTTLCANEISDNSLKSFTQATGLENTLIQKNWSRIQSIYLPIAAYESCHLSFDGNNNTRAISTFMESKECKKVIEYMTQIEQNKRQPQRHEQKIDQQKHEKMKRTKKALSRKLVRYFLKQDLHKLQTFCKEYNMEAQQRIAINSNIRTIRLSYMHTSRGGHSLSISLKKNDTKKNIHKTCKKKLNTKDGKRLLTLMLKSKN